MILMGSQRAGGKQLAAHLMNGHENEHVEIHELRGFVGEDLDAAFHEAYAIRRGTKAKQFLFSLSLNPPRDESVGNEIFEAAVDKAEARLGLSGQPRAIVFHEKDGRRHAHAVWSRIDASAMKAINMAHYKRKLREVGRELFLEHGWTMPRGFINSKERDPATYTLAEWQQAKRAGRDPKALKSLFQECWVASDSGKAFASALQARGFTLARGDRRGYVAVDVQGEVYAIAKYVGMRTKQVRERLGDAKALPSVDEAKAAMAGRMTDMLRRHVKEVEDRQAADIAKLRAALRKTIERQRHERAELVRKQEQRWARETAERTRRLSKGLRSIWDHLTGKHQKVRRQNEREALLAFYRDRAERDGLIVEHLEERQSLHVEIREQRRCHAREIEQLHQDLARFQESTRDPSTRLREHFSGVAAPTRNLPRARPRARDRGRDYER
ncbi:MAG: relaxase/mobilization nuclease domain-containing protein [Hoeflea sp. D1-CHI-28]